MGQLDGLTALVTGGASGIGLAISKMFVAEGARVVIGDVLEAEGRQLVAELGDAAAFVRQDVTREADWDAAVDAAAALGGLHGLVNNAGIYQPATLMETSAELFERHMRINQLGCFLGMKAVVPTMERSGGGSIVNVSSVEGIAGMPLVVAYTASKFAIRGMTKVAALELGPKGIRVNSVHPGMIDTKMVQDAIGGYEVDITPVTKKLALRRVGRAEEIAELVLFLASDRSSYSTGSEFVADGGSLATHALNMS